MKNVHISDEAHRVAKSKAAAEGMTLYDYLNRLIMILVPRKKISIDSKS